MRILWLAFATLSLSLACATGHVNAEEKPLGIPLQNIMTCGTPKSAKNMELWLSLIPGEGKPLAAVLAVKEFYPDCFFIAELVFDDSYMETYQDFSGARIDVRSYHAEKGIRYIVVPTLERRV